MVSINLILGHKVILSRANESDAWLAAFVLYIVLWTLYTVFLYTGRKKPIRNPSTKVLRRSHISFFSRHEMSFEMEEQGGFQITARKETWEEDGVAVADDKICGYDSESASSPEENENFSKVMLMVDEALDDDVCFDAIRLEFSREALSPQVASEMDPGSSIKSPAVSLEDAAEVRSIAVDSGERIQSSVNESPPVFAEMPEVSTEVDLDDFNFVLGLPKRFSTDGPSRHASCTDAACCY